ncbi:MAG: hypothetical protein KDC39_14225 [Actinobacteria bacterium]|nr:hypothetical protein [Actinomycetota bacterium]
MQTEYAGFFAALAGIAGALIGLLFVAISLAPDRIMGTSATLNNRETAVGAFSVLSNVMFVALSVLIPAEVLGWTTMAGALGTGLAVVVYAGLSIARFRSRPPWVWALWLLRRLATVLLVTWEFLVALHILTHGISSGSLTQLSIICLLLTAVGLDRSWELIGGQRHPLLEARRLKPEV